MKRTLYKIYTRELNSVKIVDDGLDFYFYSSFFIFYFYFILFYCSIFRTTQVSVKIIDNGLDSYFSLFILFYFVFLFFFYFQNDSGQGLSVTLSHQSQIDGIVTRLIMGLGRRKQKVLEQSDVMQHGQYMLVSCYTHGHLGQGAQQLARTMGDSI